MKKTIYTTLITALSVSTQLHAQAINTIAGGMQIGFTGDGGHAVDALLNAPAGVVVDMAGNVYFGDSKNYVVRKINAAGIISTVAGTGVKGYSIDGIAATTAALNTPFFLAIDTLGNLYIADNAFRIRKVDVSTGLISTVAGNGTSGLSPDGVSAKTAKVSPSGIAIDHANNIYFVDNTNQTVRKIDEAGKLRTIAGTGSVGDSGDGGPATAAMFGSLAGLAIDTSGVVYIADKLSNCVRKIDKDGKITTVAGNHFGSGTYDGAYGGDGGPATSAMLNYPSHIAFDKINNLYISDYRNQRIRKVSAETGIITTIAGNGIPGYTGEGSDPASKELYNPYGVAADANGRVYIADNGNNRIRAIGSPVVVKDIQAKKDGISIFPNPAKDELVLRVAIEGCSSFSIVNGIGQEIVAQAIHSLDTRIDIQLLPVGLYTIIIKGRGVMHTLMFEKSL